MLPWLKVFFFPWQRIVFWFKNKNKNTAKRLGYHTCPSKGSDSIPSSPDGRTGTQHCNYWNLQIRWEVSQWGRTYLLLCSLFAYYMLCILSFKTLAYFILHNKDIYSLILEMALPDRRSMDLCLGYCTMLQEGSLTAYCYSSTVERTMKDEGNTSAQFELTEPMSLIGIIYKYWAICK